MSNQFSHLVSHVKRVAFVSSYCALCNQPLDEDAVQAHNASSCQARRFPEYPFQRVPAK